MIYYSHRTRKALQEGRTFLPLGFAHYSYGTVCKKFLTALTEAKIEAQELVMPEVYASVAHLFPPAESARPLHIAFKPYEEIRLLKGAANVAHVAWEFDKLPQLGELPQHHPRRSNILNDYVHVLGLVSEIWVGSTYTKQVFEKHGLSNVRVLAAPIAASGRGRPARRKPAVSIRRLGSLELTRRRVAAVVESTGAPRLESNTLFRADDTTAAGGRVFLSVFNPGDARKNAAALVMGFQDFIQRSQRDDLLIIKLVLDGSKDALRTALARQFPRYFDYAGIPFNYVDCRNILLVPDRLTDEEMADLYRAADFYVCSSGAEGQGMPVQEAMAEGLVPISSRETAMGDYITEENAIVMQAADAPIPMQVTEPYALWGVSWRVVDHREVSRALARAVALSPAEYTRKSQAAAAVVRDLYGYEATVSALRARVAELAS
jgi:glycosyltransferase involved in cell wall biosynthesis